MSEAPEGNIHISGSYERLMWTARDVFSSMGATVRTSTCESQGRHRPRRAPSRHGPVIPAAAHMHKRLVRQRASARSLEDVTAAQRARYPRRDLVHGSPARAAARPLVRGRASGHPNPPPAVMRAGAASNECFVWRAAGTRSGRASTSRTAYVRVAPPICSTLGRAPADVRPDVCARVRTGGRRVSVDTEGGGYKPASSRRPRLPRPPAADDDEVLRPRHRRAPRYRRARREGSDDVRVVRPNIRQRQPEPRDRRVLRRHQRAPVAGCAPLPPPSVLSA